MGVADLHLGPGVEKQFLSRVHLQLSRISTNCFWPGVVGNVLGGETLNLVLLSLPWGFLCLGLEFYATASGCLEQLSPAQGICKRRCGQCAFSTARRFQTSEQEDSPIEEEAREAGEPQTLPEACREDWGKETPPT